MNQVVPDAYVPGQLIRRKGGAEQKKGVRGKGTRKKRPPFGTAYSVGREKPAPVPAGGGSDAKISVARSFRAEAVCF